MKKFILKHSNLVAFFLLAVFFTLGLASMWDDSGTTDEVAHIPAGYSYDKLQDYRLNPEHPPLLKMVLSAPLLFMDLTFPTDILAWQEANQWEMGWKFIYHDNNNADQIIFWNRLPILLFALLLGIYLYKWTKEVYGKKVALLALFFFALSPNILAHSRLVTTDLGVTASFFIMLYYFYKFIKNPSWLYLAASGIALGVAQLIKFSNVLLFIYLMLLFVVVLFTYSKKITFKFPFAKNIKRERLKRFYVFIASFILMVIICFVLIEAVYAFSVHNTPVDLVRHIVDVSIIEDGAVKDTIQSMVDNPVLRPMGYYLLGVKMVFQRIAGGNTTYFFGETSNQSWWYYYPLSFLIKTPISILILLMFSMVGLFKFTIKDSIVKSDKSKLKTIWLTIKNFVNKNFLEFICWTMIAMFFVVGIYSNLNIGLRHILPMYPFLFILCAKYFFKLFGDTSIILKVFGVLLLIWYALANLFVFPSYLAYFNEFVGGKYNGYKYTVDSNLDWGQDLKRLSFFVENNDIEKLTIDYFGGSVPEYFMPGKTTKWHSNLGKPKGWFAVSATYLQNSKWYSKISDEQDYAWLELHEPVAIIGGSILVYHFD